MIRLSLRSTVLPYTTVFRCLAVGGQLEIQSGARLRLDGSSPARDLTLAAGSTLSGPGTVQLEGSCRLGVPGEDRKSVGEGKRVESGGRGVLRKKKRRMSRVTAAALTSGARGC